MKKTKSNKARKNLKGPTSRYFDLFLGSLKVVVILTGRKPLNDSLPGWRNTKGARINQKGTRMVKLEKINVVLVHSLEGPYRSIADYEPLDKLVNIQLRQPFIEMASR